MENKFSNKIIPIKKMADGSALSINVIEVTGALPGPCTYIQSSVHGAEIQGNLVIYHLIDMLNKTPVNGKIILVPNANPYATIQKSGPYTQGRFNPVTGNNYNRNYTDIFSLPENQIKLTNFVSTNPDDQQLPQLFKKFISSTIDSIIEKKKPYGLSDDFFLNITLQKIASEADICLDLHTGPVACEYLYSHTNQKEEVIADFPFEFILDIPEAFAGAMDEAFFINYTHINKLLSSSNRQLLKCSSYTVELGSEEKINTKIAQEFVQKITSFLSKKNHFAEKNECIYKIKKEKKYISLQNFKTYNAPTGGHVEYFVTPGTHVQKDELLAIIYTPSNDKNGFQKIHIKALHDCWVINYQNSSTVHEGMELFQVGEDAELYLSN